MEVDGTDFLQRAMEGCLEPEMTQEVKRTSTRTKSNAVQYQEDSEEDQRRKKPKKKSKRRRDSMGECSRGVTVDQNILKNMKMEPVSPLNDTPESQEEKDAAAHVIGVEILNQTYNVEGFEDIINIDCTPISDLFGEELEVPTPNHLGDESFAVKFTGGREEHEEAIRSVGRFYEDVIKVEMAEWNRKVKELKDILDRIVEIATFAKDL